MMVAIPIAWVADSTLAAIGHELRDSLGRWAAAWGLTPPTVGTVAPIAAASAPRFAAMGSSDPAARQLCGDAEALRRAIALEVFGITPQEASSPSKGGSHGVVETVARRAAADLERTLGGQFADREPMPGATEQVSVGHWGIEAAFLACGVRIVLLSSCQALRAAGHLRQPARRALQPWSASALLGCTPVTLSAELGQASTAWGDLASLAPGDVLVLDHDALQPMRLTAANGTSVELRAFLGRRGANRACRVVAYESENSR